MGGELARSKNDAQFWAEWIDKLIARTIARGGLKDGSGAEYWNPNIVPQVRADERYASDAALNRKLRSQGIAARLVAPRPPPGGDPRVGVTSCPEAARVELANGRLRANLRNATDTIRAKRADVVVYDRLASRVLLDLAPAGAERVDVGKAPGRAAMEAYQADLAQTVRDKDTRLREQ